MTNFEYFGYVVIVAVLMFMGGWTCGYLRGATRTVDLDIQLMQCQTKLSDPHHCVSVCVEQFENMGC